MHFNYLCLMKNKILLDLLVELTKYDVAVPAELPGTSLIRDSIDPNKNGIFVRAPLPSIQMKH